MTGQDIAKVAAEAGVDARTVSRALTGAMPRSAATRVAIHCALLSFGFKREAMGFEKRSMHTPKRKAAKK